MDNRVERWLSGTRGLPLEAFPRQRVGLRESPKRTNKPRNRLTIQRIVGMPGVAATGTPQIVAELAPVLEALSIWELFSPLGMAEIERALGGEDADALFHGFQYGLTHQRDFRPVETFHETVALTRADIPDEQRELRMSERRRSITDDFVWAFACYHQDDNAPAKRLAPFGPRCASITIIVWHDGFPDIATYGLGTELGYEGQGYALATVSAATAWILQQGAVAWYEAHVANTASLRIPRRLGFSLISETIRA